MPPDIKQLAQLAKKESRAIDFKERFDPRSSQDWARIIKDIIAMANSGGGIILFGVKDNGSSSDFDKNLILSIDPAVICDKISAYTKEDFSEFDIVEIIRGRKKFAALFIASAPSPIVFTKPGTDINDGGKQKPAFVRGSVYFRHGAKSEPGTTNDIKVTVNRVVEKLKKSWLEGTRKIANIKPGEEILVSSKNNVKKTPGKIVADKDAQSFRPDDAGKIWPHRSKELIAKINEKMREKKITLHDILCVKKQYNIDESSNPELVYKPYVDVSPRYSDQFVDWILNKLQKNPNLFVEARHYFRSSQKSRI